MRNREDIEFNPAERMALLSGAGMLFLVNAVLNYQKDNPLNSIIFSLLLLVPEMLIVYMLYKLPECMHEFDRIINHRAAEEEIKRNQLIEAEQSNEMKLQLAGFPDHLVPDEFRCDISKLIMTKPVKLTGTTQTYDDGNLKQWIKSSYPPSTTQRAMFQFRNIGNNQLINFPDDVHIQLNLLKQIRQYVGIIINQIKILRQQKCMQLFVSHVELCENDYRSINEYALKMVSKLSSTPSLTPSR